MSLVDLGTLVVLALVDSTSTGTLIIPIWLLLAPQGFRIRRMAVFLLTVAAFYFVVGLLLLAGVDVISGIGENLGDLDWLRWVQLVLGVALFAYGFRPLKKTDEPPARLVRWRNRTATDGSTRGLVGLALLATTLELAMMIPYLAGVGIIASSDLNAGLSVATLAGYCLVMILPAIVLTLGRTVFRQRLDPLLQRLDAWTMKNASEMLAWVCAIVGFLLAGNAAQALELIG